MIKDMSPVRWIKSLFLCLSGSITALHQILPWNIVSARPCVKVDDDVVMVYDRVQRLDQVQQRLLQVHGGVREPLTDEHDHGTPLFIIPGVLRIVNNSSFSFF